MGGGAGGNQLNPDLAFWRGFFAGWVLLQCACFSQAYCKSILGGQKAKTMTKSPTGLKGQC
jgi:hypothetical protein